MPPTLREKLESRFGGLRDAKFPTFHTSARSFFRFYDGEEKLVALSKDLNSKAFDPLGRVRSYLHSSGVQLDIKTDADAAAQGEQFLRIIADEAQPPGAIYNEIYSRHLGAPDSSPAYEREERMMASVKAQFLEPFCLYVIEQLDEDGEGHSMGRPDLVAAHEDFSFVTDERIAKILSRDYLELQALDPTTATKSVLVLSGGIIEGLLFDALVSSGKWTFEQACENFLKDMIGLATGRGIITEDRLSHVLRKYRNLIHPGREVRDSVVFGIADAILAKSAVDIFIREVKVWFLKAKE